jgi:hypothetical protein
VHALVDPSTRKKAAAVHSIKFIHNRRTVKLLFDTLKKDWNNTKFIVETPSKFVYQLLFLVLNLHYFRISSTQNIESKCRLKPQTYRIITNLVLNYLESKMTLYYFSVDIWVDTSIALKEHNISVERYINHFKVSNQDYLKLSVDQYFKSIDSIVRVSEDIRLNLELNQPTILLLLYVF